MDKYEYKLKLDQMKSLTAEHNYEKAAEIADTINWNKIKNVNGYQIVYANNKNFKKASTVMTTKTNCTIKKLKKKKTYYIKVRAYKKTASGKKTFGAYSKVVKIKISK